jgi:cohesin complex subunit SCC1
VQLTPRAAADGDAEATADEAGKKQRKIKEKKQIIDTVTELEDGPGPKTGRGRGGLGGPVNKDLSEILAEPQFLPRSAVVMRLLEIREDPLAHFMPTKTTSEGTFFCGAPPGLAPELAEMFMQPLEYPSGKKRAASPGKDKGKKKAKIDEGSGLDDDDEVEKRLRASVAPSMGIGSVMGRGSVVPEDFTLGIDDGGMAIDDFQLDVPPADQELGRASVAPSERSRISRMSTPALFDEGELSYADANCPIASFDSRPSQQSQQTSSEMDRDAEVADDGKEYSKNTVKALGIIRRELRPTEEEPEADRVMSFEQMADKVGITTILCTSRVLTPTAGISASSIVLLFRTAGPGHPRLREGLPG